MERQNSIDELLENFETESKDDWKARDRYAVTVWLTPDAKEKYDDIQRRSGRRFSRILREVVERAIAKKFQAEV